MRPSISFKKVSGAKKYEVYRSTKKSGGFKRVAAVKSPSYVDKNLRLQQTYYYYKVRAVNGKFKGAFSSVRSIVAWLAPP